MLEGPPILVGGWGPEEPKLQAGQARKENNDPATLFLFFLMAICLFYLSRLCIYNGSHAVYILSRFIHIFCFCLQLYLQVCRSGFSMHTKRARPCRAKAKITENPRTRSTTMQCERPPPTAAKKKMKPSAIVAISLEGFCPSICRWSDLTPACPP